MQNFLIGLVLIFTSVGLQSCEQSSSSSRSSSSRSSSSRSSSYHNKQPCFEMVESRAVEIMKDQNVSIEKARGIVLREIGKEIEEAVAIEMTLEHGATYNGKPHPAILKRAANISFRELRKLQACLGGHIMREKGRKSLSGREFDYYYFGIDTVKHADAVDIPSPD